MPPKLVPNEPKSLSSRRDSVDCNQVTSQDFPRWWLKVKIQGRKTRSLLDSGSARTIMEPLALEIAKEKGVKLREFIGSGVRVANGNFAPIFSTAVFDFVLGNSKKSLEVLIMPNLSTDCILGADFIRLFNVVLYPCKSEITADGLEVTTPVELASVSVESGTTGLSKPNARTTGPIESTA